MDEITYELTARVMSWAIYDQFGMSHGLIRRTGGRYSAWTNWSHATFDTYEAALSWLEGEAYVR